MKSQNMNSIYELTRNYFNFTFDNPEQLRPINTALYFYIVDLSNRLGWKPKLSIRTSVAMEALGIKDYKAYQRAFNELVKADFITLIQKAKNQHATNIIVLENIEPIKGKTSLDRAHLQDNKLAKNKSQTKIESDYE